MRIVKPTNEQIIYAKSMADEMGKINRSIRNGEGNVYGFLGEKIVYDLYNKYLEIENTYEYDLVYNLGNKKYKIDVKTKCTTVPPEPHFECSIVYYKKQECDIYLFTRIMKDLSFAYILGYITPEEYFKKAIYRKKGELDPNSTPHRPFYFKESCYNLKISELRSIERG
jgi:hypothetical protein